MSYTISSSTSVRDGTSTLYAFTTTCVAVGSTETVPSPSTYSFPSSEPPSLLVTLYEAVVPTCQNYANCRIPIPPDPDVAGLGVILAFLITAWFAFAFLAVAYFVGLLPPEHIRLADRICFHATSKRCRDKWKDTLDKVILTFSDQQLITGLSIMIAGYVESVYSDLDAYHWYIIVYLAWMSSTVHLITLTLLRTWMNENPLLRNLRMFGMAILLGLLAVALYPSTHTVFLDSISDNYKLPANCFWEGKRIKLSFWPDRLSVDAILSYIALFLGYIWKIAQIVDGNHQWLRRHLIVPPVMAVERSVKRLTDARPTMWTRKWIALKLVLYAYVLLTLLIEIFKSFMTTLLFLLVTLTWGTVQLIQTRATKASTILHAESSLLSFGQLLPLLLLLQPLANIIEHFAKKTSAIQPTTQPHIQAQNPTNPAPPPSSPIPMTQKQPTIDIINSNAETAQSQLSFVFRTKSLLDKEQKVRQEHTDPFLQYTSQSRVFRFMIWWAFAMAATLAAVVIAFVVRYMYLRLEDGANARLVVLKYGVPSAVFSVPFMLAVLMPWSRKLG